MILNWKKNPRKSQMLLDVKNHFESNLFNSQNTMISFEYVDFWQKKMLSRTHHP